MPVQVGSLAWPWRYSSARRPTEAALTRSGMSLLTRVTSRPSAARLSATERIRASLLSVRNPGGSTPSSVWLSSTRSVPPTSLAGTGRSSRPCRTRRSSSIRSDCRANQPSSGWCRLPSSSVMTTRGSTTSCSANRWNAAGSESSTDVSRTKAWPAGRGSLGSAGAAAAERRLLVARRVVAVAAGVWSAPAVVRRVVTGLLRRMGTRHPCSASSGARGHGVGCGTPCARSQIRADRLARENPVPCLDASPAGPSRLEAERGSPKTRS